MLKSIDMLIGLSVVMLMVSLAVTVLTQAILNALNTRGTHLKRGLEDLLKQLDPALEQTASKVATAVLRHPLTRELSMLGFARMGTVIQREEFTKLLLALATGGLKDQATQDRLGEALAANGIADPAATLQNIRLLALKLEASNPDLASSVRQSAAILHEAASPLVAKINAWFDQTMDRTSERFTFSTRIITFACSLVVALALQLDSIALINRLSTDDAFRSAVVEQATPLLKQKIDNAAETIGAKPLSEQQQQLLLLAGQGIVTIPTNVDACSGFDCAAKWWQQWLKTWAHKSVFGVLLSTLLLSMGAPFWYSTLRELVNLRSVLARKDDEQRGERQTTQAVAATPAGPAPAPAAPELGERGNLNALG